jgi:glycosyltransferase involved in cell wall biosynthesis
MSFVIFGELFTFPDGQAATNRIYTYAKGFKENGINVHVICYANNYTEKPNGTTEGISYYHPFEQARRNKYFIVRRWQNLVKNIRTYKLLKKINREDKIIAINTWTENFFVHLFIWILAKMIGTKVIVECSEHPMRLYQNGRLRKITGRLKLRIEPRLCNGILCISRFIIEFYKKHGVKEKKLFLLPSTVDPGRFILSGEKPVSGTYIGYFGSLSFKRDSVDILIKAFARFSSSHPQVQLVLGGFCTEELRKKIQDLIQELNIAEKVTILEFLTRQEVIKYITHADILVMMRSRDLESDASYPSKLTEFLATGKPVVSVNVGEISDFLKDGENSFLVEPGNPEELADKLDFIINNYEQAKQIGQKGKELTQTVFNYNYQAKRMIGYINSLNNGSSLVVQNAKEN